MSDNKVEPKVEDRTYTAQDFAQAYQELCEKYKFRIVVSPIWVSTNHNSFEMVNQYTIGALSKQEEVK